MCAFFNKIKEAFKGSQSNLRETENAQNEANIQWGIARVSLHAAPNGVKSVAYDPVQVCMQLLFIFNRLIDIWNHWNREYWSWEQTMVCSIFMEDMVLNMYFIWNPVSILLNWNLQ